MKLDLNFAHRIVVTLFFLIYFIKTILLVINKHEALKKFTKVVRIPEMIISLLFLMTGIWLMVKLPEISAMLIIKICVVMLSIPVAIVGFKKKNKALAILSFLMIAGGYGIAEASKKRREKPKENTVLATAGVEEIYNNDCAICHGKDGKLGLSGSFDLSKSTLSHTAVVSVIVNGRNTMPSNKGRYTPEQVEKIATYVESLRGK